MTFCKNCGFQISDEVAFCGKCGTKIAEEKKEAICNKCGNVIEEDLFFCSKCGTRKVEVKQASTINYEPNIPVPNTFKNELYIKKIIQDNDKEITVEGTTLVEGVTSIEALIRRANLFLEDGDFSSANKYFERILDQNPEEPRAYIGKLMVDLQICFETQLSQSEKRFSENKNFIKAIRSLNENLKEIYNGYNQAVLEQLEVEAKKLEAERMQAPNLEIIYLRLSQEPDTRSIRDSFLEYKDILETNFFNNILESLNQMIEFERIYGDWKVSTLDKLKKLFGLD